MNWGIIVAALASFIFGWLFYSPAVFGNLWLRLSGIDKKKMREMQAKGGMGGKMLIALLAAIVTAWVLYVFMIDLEIYYNSEVFSFIWKVWLGFIVSTVLIGSVLWENKRVGLLFLNALYWLLNLMIMAFVLVAF